MITRWHLDLLAVATLVGLAAVLIELRANRRTRPGAARAEGDHADPVRIPPATVIGLALLVAGVFDLVNVPAFAALTILAGVIGCRRPLITATVALLFLVVPAVEGFGLPIWLLVLLAVVLSALVLPAHIPVIRLTRGAPFTLAPVLPTTTAPAPESGGPTQVSANDLPGVAGPPALDPADRSPEPDSGNPDSPSEPDSGNPDSPSCRIDETIPATAVVALLVAAALWTAAPDTELPLAAGGALLAPAARDLLDGRGLRPDAFSLMAVTVAAAIGFVGRPAGAVVLALVAPVAWIATGPATRARIAATGVAVVTLVAACRSGGLRHHLDRAIPPTVISGVVMVAVLVALSFVERRFGPDPPTDADPY